MLNLIRNLMGTQERGSTSQPRKGAATRRVIAYPLGTRSSVVLFDVPGANIRNLGEVTVAQAARSARQAKLVVEGRLRGRSITLPSSSLAHHLQRVDKPSARFEIHSLVVVMRITPDLVTRPDMAKLRIAAEATKALTVEIDSIGARQPLVVVTGYDVLERLPAMLCDHAVRVLRDTFDDVRHFVLDARTRPASTRTVRTVVALIEALLNRAGDHQFDASRRATAV